MCRTCKYSHCIELGVILEVLGSRTSSLLCRSSTGMPKRKCAVVPPSWFSATKPVVPQHATTPPSARTARVTALAKWVLPVPASASMNTKFPFAFAHGRCSNFLMHVATCCCSRFNLLKQAAACERVSAVAGNCSASRSSLLGLRAGSGRPKSASVRSSCVLRLHCKSCSRWSPDMPMSRISSP